MQFLKTVLFALILNLAMPGIDVAATDTVEGWKVGQKVAFWDQGLMLQGIIAEAGGKIPFLRDAYVKIKTNSGEFRELKLPHHSLWSAEYACDSRGLCVGQRTFVETRWYTIDDVLDVKVVSIIDGGGDATALIGELTKDQGRYKTGDLIKGQVLSFGPDEACNAKNICSGDEVMFYYEDIVEHIERIERGKIFKLVEGRRCGEQNKPVGGFVIERYDGSLTLSIECFYNYKTVAKIMAQGECDPDSDLCRGQPVYFFDNGPWDLKLGYIVTSNGSRAYVQVQTPSRYTDIIRVGILAVVEGCLSEHRICVGDKVLVDHHESPVLVLARYRNSSKVILEPSSGRGVIYEGKDVYVRSGCSPAGFCVGDSVRVNASGHRAEVIGIKGELLAIKFLSGERAGQIGFERKPSELSK